MLLDPVSGGMAKHIKVTNALLEGANELLEFDDLMAELDGKIAPEVASKVVESYGRGFRDLSHVYEDMLARARACDCA